MLVLSIQPDPRNALPPSAPRAASLAPSGGGSAAAAVEEQRLFFAVSRNDFAPGATYPAVYRRLDFTGSVVGARTGA